MKKIISILFIFILSACTSLQVTEETDCCLAVDFTAPVPTETQTPTQIYPSESATATSTYETKISEKPYTCRNESTYYTYSPNGIWQVEFCYFESEERLALVLFNQETRVFWKIIYRDYIPPTLDSDGGLAVAHWSNDGKYAYFDSYSSGSGGECFMFSNDSGRGVFQLDLQTGDINTILPVINDLGGWYLFSFSPTDRRLVYGGPERVFSILDITTGDTIKVNPNKDYDNAGGFKWSKNGLRFVYSTSMRNYDSITGIFYALHLVDAKTGIQKTVLESPHDCFQAVEWLDTDILKIHKNYNESIIEFDLTTNSIISETPINP